MNIPQPTPDAQVVDWFSLSSGMMGLGWIATLVVLVLIIVGITSVVRLVRMSLESPDRTAHQQQSPLQILNQRYARGQISREEYEQKRADMEC
ncbi:SHOCT domain-containing protein [Chitinimonas naiadis]